MGVEEYCKIRESERIDPKAFARGNLGNDDLDSGFCQWFSRDKGWRGGSTGPPGTARAGVEINPGDVLISISPGLDKPTKSKCI